MPEFKNYLSETIHVAHPDNLFLISHLFVYWNNSNAMPKYTLLLPCWHTYRYHQEIVIPVKINLLPFLTPASLCNCNTRVSYFIAFCCLIHRYIILSCHIKRFSLATHRVQIIFQDTYEVTNHWMIGNFMVYDIWIDQKKHHNNLLIIELR